MKQKSRLIKKIKLLKIKMINIIEKLLARFAMKK